MYRTRLPLFIIFIIMMAQFAEASVDSYVVLPFKVNAPSSYTYLEKAIPSMLTSRLYWEERFQPITDIQAGKVGKITSTSEMSKARIATGADYLIWGEVNIVGDDATIEVRVCDRNEKIWRKNSTTKVNNLITTLQDMAEAINNELFGRATTKPLITKQHETITQVNPGLVHSQTGEKQVFLNPQLRYQGTDESRTRSQALPFASIGMIVADLTGNKKNEIAILSEYKIHVYRWEEGRLAPLGEYKLPRSFEPILIRNFDIDHDGIQEIIVTCFDSSYKKPYSCILSFRDGIFKEVATNIPYYLNVVELPPNFSPVLIGQKSDNANIFSRTGVYEIEMYGSNCKMGKQITLPKEANIFNFSWLPAGSQSNENDKIVLVTNKEQLAVYNPAGSRLYVTDDSFYGSSVGIEEQTNMPGLGKNKNILPSRYFIPSRMIPIDLEQTGQWELLVNKPISVAAKFFENYRSFPEGEIQALSWDGIGLNLIWKTRRIKGTTTDFALADANNDGMLDLVVSVNTHTGLLGLEHRRTIILFYPLDMSKGNSLKIIEDE